MQFSALLLALFSIGLTQAVVQFSKSALYDVYDFVGVDEVPLPLCDNGCYIFASTIGKGTNPITKIDLYADELIISSDGGRTGHSVARLSLLFDGTTTKKVPMIYPGGSRLSIFNQNIEQDRFNSLVVYVVDSKVAEATDFEIYDSVNMDMGVSVPANVTTIMSAIPFTFSVKGDKGVKNSATIRLTGFDNAADSYGDECPIAFQTSTTSNSLAEIDISAPVPIVSFTFSQQTARVQIAANHNFYNNIEFYDDGFITSAGWNGCRKPASGGYQSFRSPNYITSNSYMIMTNDDSFSVHLDADMHLDENHKLLVRDLTNWNDVNWYGSYETGTEHKELSIEQTLFCEFKSREMEGDQGFIVRHYGKIFIDDGKTTTRRPTTASTSTTDSGAYCKCDVDKFGMPLDWKSTDIWLDIVIVLDTSEALSAKSLQDAATFTEALIGNDDGDVLNTDHNKPYYTRVGVIAMADSPQILYNMNLTKRDPVKSRVSSKKGLAEIDLTKAFAAAEQMLADGLISEPNRASARQVVHFLTNSQPKPDTAAMNAFKSSGGVVIVNNVLNSGEEPKSDLKTLASDGFFFSDVNGFFFVDVADNVQALCKANCFCSVGLVPYAGGVQAPTLQAAGGCYSASVASVPFTKAKQTCAGTKSGIIATDHDGSKGAFLNKLISDAVPRQYFFWIGYSKSDDGNWQWEDKSNDSYTNWAAGEPSNNAVAKCAYVDQSSSSLQWGASNCNIGFPFACEYAPCSAGNKNC